MDLRVASEFGLDPDVVHLNHGAFGCAPLVVREAAAAWRERAERNPHRFNRVELPGLVAGVRAAAADFLGLPADACGLVRNVSEGVSSVLASLDLAPGDEVVLNDHGYGAVRIAVEHWVRRRGARLVVVPLAVGTTGTGADVVAAYADACSPATRLVVVDAITSPTATVLPAAAVCAAVADRAGPRARVLVDAAHVPGTLPADPLADGAHYWVGNLHKWAYTPRGTAVLWAREDVRDGLWPLTLSWQLEDGYGPRFDYPGTWDYAGWLAAPDGLAHWRDRGGWAGVDALSATVTAGQARVAERLGTDLGGLDGPSAAPTMRLVRLPDGVVDGPDGVAPAYERWSARGVEAAPQWQPGAGAFVRVAAAPYTTPDDYDALADTVLA